MLPFPGSGKKITRATTSRSPPGIAGSFKKFDSAASKANGKTAEKAFILHDLDKRSEEKETVDPKFPRDSTGKPLWGIP
jgi:hypothetical protein